MPSSPVNPDGGSSRAERGQDGPTTMPVQPTGWWETERATLIRGRIAELTRHGSVVVDVGCGRADMLDAPLLADRMRINVDSHAWPEWTHREGMLFVVANAHALPFRSGFADLVGSFDVLEHVRDDTRALREQRRIAAETATLVAAVPADPRLWSAHDEAVGHQRRYTDASFARLARSAELDITRRSHFYSFLWLPAWLARRSSARAVEPAGGDDLTSRLLKRVIAVLAAAERAVMRRWSIPFGTSAWYEMVKSGASTDRRRTSEP